VLLVAAAGMGAAVLALPAAASAEKCPNEQFRVGPSAALPDCRAYELVSPLGIDPWIGPEHIGAEHLSSEQTFVMQTQGAVASVTGDRFAFYTKGPVLPESPAAYFLSTRGLAGWSTRDLTPPQSTDVGILCVPYMSGYTPDMSKGVLADGLGQQKNEGHANHECGHDEPRLVEGEPQGFQNLFVQDNQGGSYELVNLTPAAVVPNDAVFQAGSTDFTHVVFSENAQLTPGAPTTRARGSSGGHFEDLFEYFGGAVRLVTVLPGATPVFGLLANGLEGVDHPGSALLTHAVSGDGERVYFYAEGEVPSGSLAGAKLYLRENAAQPPLEECAAPNKACTIQIDLAESGSAGPSGAGIFQWASADGSKVFFTDEGRLTTKSTAEAGKPDLYEYDLANPLGERLTDLTANAGEAANVLGVSGVSETGSYVYFVATGALTGSEENSQGAKAEAGKPNLYLRHAGITTFIATLLEASEVEACDWESFKAPLKNFSGCPTSRISSNGAFLAFNSLKRITHYDNTDVSTGEPDQEIFLYDAAEKKLSCASCDPSGAPPAWPASIRTGQVLEQVDWPPTQFARFLSDSGQVFFDTRDRLSPGDKNGLRNVYEYQAGRLSLISSGASSESAYFYGASASGKDLFFLTTQALVGQDTDNTISLYDARVGGGFLEPPSARVCEGEAACLPGVPPPSALSSPASAFFSGPGNPPAATSSGPPPKPRVCRKGFKKTKVHGRTACKRVRKQNKRKHLARHARGAGYNQGGRK
jgi:hypothetical protein